MASVPSGGLRPPLAGLVDGSGRRGFTLIELLIVSAIMAILVALLLPAVQQAREAAHRASCKNNLRQLGVALQNYYDQYEMFPAGTVNPEGPIHNEPQGYHHNWIIALLPHLERRPLADAIDTSVGIYASQNAFARETRLPVLLCPSDSGPDRADATGEDLEPFLTNFAGCHHPVEVPIDDDNRGVLFLNSYVRIPQIEDGTSQTIAAGEIMTAADDLGWASGTRATLRNCGLPVNQTPGGASYYFDQSFYFDALSGWQRGPDGLVTGDLADPADVEAARQAKLVVGGFGSHHTGGTHVLLVDGSVRFISQNIGPTMFKQLGDRADYQLLEAF